MLDIELLVYYIIIQSRSKDKLMIDDTNCPKLRPDIWENISQIL